MSVKMNDVRREIVEKIVAERSMVPAFVGQSTYIAKGPTHEILASMMPNGLYHVELLDREQMEESLQRTIKNFREYSEGGKA
jgi:hypothetical protein